MGQYQTRPSKSDLEERENDLDLQDDSLVDISIINQPTKDEPVFGSPIDSE